MTLDAIRKTILEDAEKKAEEIAGEGTSEASRITKEAEDKAKAIIKDAEHEAQREAERLRKESDAGVEIEANSMLLSARGEAVERSLRKVLSGAEEHIQKEDMKKLLEQGIKQFSQITPESSIVIRTSKKNAPLLKGYEHRVEYKDIDGFMLCTSDGKIALNATVGNIVQSSAENARRIIAEELFKEREKPSAEKKPRASAERKQGKKRR
jgi:vacuolar-type H+-ATPase subunit E/Vma4